MSAFSDMWARVMFLNFSKLHEPQASAIWEPKKHPEWPYIMNARAIKWFFIYNILNKIIKESIFGHFLWWFSCSYSSSLGLNFLSIAHFFQTFIQVCVDLIHVFVFLHLVSVGEQLFRRTKQIAFSRPFFSFSIATFVLHFITSICTLLSIDALIMDQWNPFVEYIINAINRSHWLA